MPPTSLHPVYVYENMIEGGDPPYTNTPDTYESAPAGICYTFADTVLLIVPMFHVNAWGLPFASEGNVPERLIL